MSVDSKATGPKGGKVNGKELLDKAKAGMMALVNGGDWQAYLDTMRKFHSYSVYNQMLILMQRPDATQVAGYNRWAALKRQVRKGEKGIAILAPIVVNDTKEDENGERKAQKHLWFKTVYVFDVSQTDGDPLPTMMREVSGESALLGLLSNVVGKAGLELVKNTLPECWGWYSARKGQIAIGEKSGATNAAVLAHELGHWALGHNGPNDDPQRQELEAESVSYMVCADLGLDTGEHSAAYMLAWAKGDAEQGAKLIQDSLNKILSAYQKIMALAS